MTTNRDLDQIASEYDSLSDFDHHAIAHEADLFLADYVDGAVLELGCARGGMTRKLAPIVDRLVVVDGSETYLTELRRDLGQQAEFVSSRFEDYDPASTFRHVLAARILEHLQEPVAFLKRLRGWLEPHGMLHVIVPNARSFHRLLGLEMGLIKDLHELGERDRRVGHVRVYDSDMLMRDLESAGFRVTWRRDVMLKPLSNAQMETWEPAIIDALFRMARHFPDHGNELYFRCEAARVRP
ncbi:MAG TPA: methyltransferase domain-containing protein [Candidatus Binatia bacterium]|jgi:trans-aconitate methyltransferase